MVTQWLAGQDVTVDRLNDNHPRTINYAAITANSTASSGTTESIAITSGTTTFRNNRAFRITFKGLFQSTVNTDTANFKIRRTNASGLSLLDTQRTQCITSSSIPGNVLGYWQNIITNTTGSDITDVLVVTYSRGTGGTGNITVAASAGQPAYLEIEDIGNAADFASATALS